MSIIPDRPHGPSRKPFRPELNFLGVRITLLHALKPSSETIALWFLGCDSQLGRASHSWWKLQLSRKERRALLQEAQPETSLFKKLEPDMNLSLKQKPLNTPCLLLKSIALRCYDVYNEATITYLVKMHHPFCTASKVLSEDKFSLLSPAEFDSEACS